METYLSFVDEQDEIESGISSSHDKIGSVEMEVSSEHRLGATILSRDGIINTDDNSIDKSYTRDMNESEETMWEELESLKSVDHMLIENESMDPNEADSVNLIRFTDVLESKESCV